MDAYDLRKLRACMVCGTVRTFDHFRDEGCPNCESFLSLRGSSERILDSTSATFSGLVGMVQPKGSWVARWQRAEERIPGLYALKVVGRLPEDILDILGTRGVRPVVSDI